MTADTIPVAPLSIWDPVHLGTDELGRRVQVTLAERNMLIGGEPGGGKSVALQLIVAHGALSADCRLILIDGKRVELGLWRDCAERFIGPSIDDAIDTLHWLQAQIDQRTEELLACSPPLRMSMTATFGVAR
jgi:DNA segregation ATPase FtsK/SpoIIIE, S-DNA-T family